MNLQAIKARCTAATDGPWGAHEACRPAYCEIHNAHTLENGESAIALVEYPENVQFIAHAREDVPALVAEVERLTVGIKEIGEQCAKRHDKIKWLENQLAAAVEDLSKYPDRCLFCKSHVDSEECANAECKIGEQWVWRGPQEGESENA